MPKADNWIELVRADPRCTVGAGCSDRDISSLTTLVGAPLPPELEAYCRGVGHMLLGTTQLFGFGVKLASAYGLVERYQSDVLQQRPDMTGKVIPIAELGNGDLFFVDVTDGEIVLHDHELDEWTVAASSLSKWVKKVLKSKGLSLL